MCGKGFDSFQKWKSSKHKCVGEKSEHELDVLWGDQWQQNKYDEQKFQAAKDHLDVLKWEFPLELPMVTIAEISHAKLFLPRDLRFIDPPEARGTLVDTREKLERLRWSISPSEFATISDAYEIYTQKLQVRLRIMEREVLICRGAHKGLANEIVQISDRALRRRLYRELLNSLVR